MNYSLLKAWVQEYDGRIAIIEKAEVSPGFLCLKHKNTATLAVLMSKGEALLYWDESKATMDTWTSQWKSLSHAKLSGIDIDSGDRIVRLNYSNDDIYGQKTAWVLILELNNTHPNAILCKEEAGKLIIREAMEKYSYADNPQRQILPALEYQPPNTRYNPQVQEVRLPLELKLPLGESLSCSSVNSYFEQYHKRLLIERMRIEEQRKALGFWQRELKKTQRKYEQQQQDLQEAQQGEYWFVCAELLKYNLADIAKGSSCFEAINYHDPSLSTLKVKLNPEKSASENLNIYLKKYHKAKSGLLIIENNLTQTKAEIDKLEATINRLLQGEMILPPGAGKIKKLSQKMAQADKLLSFRINADYEIFIGRKARENDFVTTQLGRPTDWWFHTRIYHGSHVLLRSYVKKDPDPDLIGLCASLAAWYSKARFSQNVPVDYTQIRFVRKPRKSAPGFVIYTNQKTIYANPLDLRAVKRILGHEGKN